MTFKVISLLFILLTAFVAAQAPDVTPVLRACQDPVSLELVSCDDWAPQVRTGRTYTPYSYSRSAPKISNAPKAVEERAVSRDFQNVMNGLMDLIEYVVKINKICNRKYTKDVCQPTGADEKRAIAMIDDYNKKVVSLNDRYEKAVNRANSWAIKYKVQNKDNKFEKRSEDINSVMDKSGLGEQSSLIKVKPATTSATQTVYGSDSLFKRMRDKFNRYLAQNKKVKDAVAKGKKPVLVPVE